MKNSATPRAGSPTPLGATVTKTGINFALFSAHAEAVTLCLFSSDGKTETARIPLTAKTDDIWHGFVDNLKEGQLYGYRVDGPYSPQEGHRFNPHKLLIDPYAKQLFGDFILDEAIYGFDVNSPDADLSFDRRDSAPFVPKCVAGNIRFDWGSDEPPYTDLSDTIIYECHIKGLTRLHPDISEPKRGNVDGLASPAMIEHLTSLGVTAVEILPLQSFFSEPRLLEMGLTNYWGYNPVNYFAPHNAYLGSGKDSSIQNMVKALHAAGIEVILDVVYNHTAESWELGPTLSYRGIDNKSYYHLKDDARYYENYTGCGNALSMTNSAVLDLTISSLRYWVETYHIDGFRFDLGPTMGRNPYDFDREAPFFKAIHADPVLSKVKLIAEPWDIGPHGYQLGGFPKDWQEWNDQYRDAVRSFWRGDDGAHQNLAGRLLGSPENFDHSGRSALSSVNFISAHDGFSLQDTVSYNHKHNLANGEENRDGHNHNLSDNMGVEGSSENPEIIAKRRRRKINMLATLMLSQGIPMLLAGDEFGQSKQGNNNAYCQDNALTWLNWSSKDAVLQNAVKELIALRKRLPHFTQTGFLHGEELDETGLQNIVWLSEIGKTMTPSEWEQGNRTILGMMLSQPHSGSVLVIFNRGKALNFDLPYSGEWKLAFSSGDLDLAPNSANIPADSVTVLTSIEAASARDMFESRLDKEADRAGIISEFRDISGHIHLASRETKSSILQAMDGSYNLDVSPYTPHETPKVYGAEKLKAEGKIWGVTAALYGLKSDRNWSIGDYEDLAQLAETLAGKGADFIGINPVHALFPTAPNLFAPYSPSSRETLNIYHIAPDKIAELDADYLHEVEDELDAVRRADFVDYPEVYRLKMQAFEAAYQRFKTLKKPHPRQKAFQTFRNTSGEGVEAQAIFDAIFETLPESMRTYKGFRNFPKVLQSYGAPGVKKFAAENSDRVTFYLYLQWIAQDQLKEAQRRALAAGMTVGLYLDFAVGVVPGGVDAWRHETAFAKNISLGAPGDAANPDGQLWNLLPFDPHQLAANNYEPYRTMLRQIMDFAGAVRIDHILGHMRSFWVPKDDTGCSTSGAYVRYPLDGLLAMIAEESQAAQCIVIGEDLGTIPDGLRKKMEQSEIMGCGIVIIERDQHGRILPMKDVRELSLTAFSNHDFPTLAGFWDGADFEWRDSLGMSADPNILRYERERRQMDKDVLSQHSGFDSKDSESLTAKMAAALHRSLASSPALAVAVQLEDLLLQRAQPNVPGTTDEQPNWRRKYTHKIEDLMTTASVIEITDALRTVRPR